MHDAPSDFHSLITLITCLISAMLCTTGLAGTERVFIYFRRALDMISRSA